MNNRPIFLAAASALVLTACADPGPYNPNDPNRNTRQGAIIGGVGGALAGIATGDDADERRERAVIGGIVGAAGGAAIGNRLDQQARELEASFANDRIGVVNTGDQLIVRMPQDILFATDSATVNPQLSSDLNVLASSLNRYPNSTVQVVGHTDNTGTAAYNQDLSERRALAVTAILQNAGVSPARLRALGAGEDQPIASNLTPEGRAQNRRVDITITPN